LAAKLSVVGLVPARQSAALGPFLRSYVSGRTDVKRRSTLNYGMAVHSLLECFGESKPLRDFTEVDAERFRVWLKEQGYAEATVSRRVKYGRQFFSAALRRRLVTANPFLNVKAGNQANPDRFRFVTLEETEKLPDNCPDAEWRLIVALARYGGLRIPSEALTLTWADIDWANNRFRVRSPKTEHHEGRGVRLVPLFPELRPYLERAFEAAPEGAVYVIGRSRNIGVNWRTQLERILDRVGLSAWPRLYQNLRASRETELTQSFPSHVCAAWIGHSVKVAEKHYLGVREDDFQRAADATGEAAQYVQETARKASYRKPETTVFPEEYGPLHACMNVQVRPAGFEPATNGLEIRCSIP
jgi:integrase